MDDRIYMRRALELAAHGKGTVSPNPMVGAVIVCDGLVIGEGFHRRWGEAHAEVNAVNSVQDKSRLRGATIYVTLEPCSHYGKTPPCASLLVECGFGRVVIGCLDPFEKVSGRGAAMIREAGIDVRVGVLEDECRALNYKFMLAHERRRPVVTIKWAQSRDGWMDRRRVADMPAQRFSTPLTELMTARLRAENDVIVTTGATVRADNPRLSVRGWAGRDPRPVVITSQRLPEGCRLGGNPETTVYDEDFEKVLDDLYQQGVVSVLVEAGPSLLRDIISRGLWDMARVEIANMVLGEHGTANAPVMAELPCREQVIGANRILYFSNGMRDACGLAVVKNL